MTKKIKKIGAGDLRKLLRNLLYVGITRAMDNVNVFAVGHDGRALNIGRRARSIPPAIRPGIDAPDARTAAADISVRRRGPGC